VEIEVTRPFRKEDRKARFRATYRVTDVPSPGCVQVTVTLATRIQLSQQILKEGYQYTESLLGECVKELQQQGIARIELQCMEQNEAAQCLYAKHGFKQVDAGIVFAKSI